MATPAKPRSSGLPAPKSSALPTPTSRSRSSSVSANNVPPVPPSDAELMSRAFQDAIKANDPAQHRAPRHSDSSTSSISAPVLTQSLYGRPPSAAAKSRPKTPSAVARPQSRASDAFGRSVSRAGREFEVGDPVRIESLGMEGTLRYLGAIDGKEGFFAGVELAPGFAGHGKNDGSVAGKYYFRCPEKCGVFVPYAKLSQPAFRPSSVASSRNDPSVSASLKNGRVTPSSFTNGRVTPASSSGRITPGLTPSARPRQLTKSSIAKTPTAKSSSSMTTTAIKTPVIPQVTPGSRAAKLAAMTAKQLSSTQNGVGASVHDNINASPTRIGGLASPLGSSAYGTPKAKLAGLLARQPSTGATPTKTHSSSGSTAGRPRIPSAVAMPPPPSPSLSYSSPSRSVSRSSDFRDDLTSMSEIARAGKALQDRMAELSSAGSISRPESAAAVRSEYTAQIERLQARLNALEYENERLRNPSPPAVTSPPLPPPSSPPTTITTTEQTEPEIPAAPVPNFDAERESFLAQISELEIKLDNATKATKESESKVDSLIQSHKQQTAELEKQVNERSKAAEEYKVKLDDAVGELQGLLSIISTKEEEERKNEQLILEKEGKVAEIEKKYSDALTEWEEERKDLNGQVDELRQAGQETIALYEEKLNTAEAQKYELNARVSSLQATLHRRSASQASTTPSTTATSAIEIDNETLREHVTHLQKRISSLEDQLEDQRAIAERDDAAAQERLKRAKEKEDAIKKELMEMKKEMDGFVKAEMQARARVEEIEEALRENGVALENARAEVEVIRAEMADLDGLVGTGIEGDLHARVAQAIERATTDKKRYTDEIQRLQQLLESKGSSTAADTTSLNDTLANLETRNTELENLNRTHLESLENERKAHEEIQRLLDERTSELDTLKKKLNREHGINGITRPTSPAPPTVPKSELVSAKDEIKGLKHIIQELQKENSAVQQQRQVLESENQLLSQEADHLRQEIKILEENLDTSVGGEDGNPMSPPPSADVETLRKMMQEQKTKYEAELAQQRKKVADVEQKSARTAHDLNKEISELEALVESKIYREDELEREIERLKRQRKSTKISPEPPAERASRASTASSVVSVDSASTEQQEVCEICEQPGHDIFNCNLLKDDGKASQPFSVSTVPVDLFCEDCEGHGHTAANCPHSLDVF